LHNSIEFRKLDVNVLRLCTLVAQCVCVCVYSAMIFKRDPLARNVAEATGTSFNSNYLRSIESRALCRTFAWFRTCMKIRINAYDTTTTHTGVLYHVSQPIRNYIVKRIVVSAYDINTRNGIIGINRSLNVARASD